MKKVKLKLTKSNVVLVGFMGVGKSAVGRELAARLGKDLVEVDNFIVQRAGKSIVQIFEDGEIAFREMEIEAVKEISQGHNKVIACGGGVVLNKINIDRLKQDSVIVWLTARPAVILKRTRSDRGARPLLRRDSSITDIRDLLNFRKPYYERAADLQVDTSSATVQEVTEEIIRKLSEYANNDPEK